MMKGHVAAGVLKGAGAAVNVECGFVPDLVITINPTSGSTETLVVSGVRGVVGFDSGSTEIVVGDTVKSATAGGTALVEGVKLVSGAWGDGDAAGFLVVTTVSGTITNNEAVTIVGREGRAEVADAATFDGTVVYPTVDVDTEAGYQAAFVLPYMGTSAATSRGFTLGASALPSGEYVHWFAVKSDNFIL